MLKIIIVHSVLILVLIGAVSWGFMHPPTVLIQRVETRPKKFTWNHYVDRTQVKFEIDYPEYITPGVERDIMGDENVYSIGFLDELTISSEPLKKIGQVYDPHQSLFGLDDEFVKTIKISGYDASVFKPKGEGETFRGKSFGVTLYIPEKDRLYRLYFPNPTNAEHMLASFRVLP